MARQSDVADAAPAIDPEWLRARCDAYGLTDERRAELEAMMAAIPWADPELAVERWLGCEADGLHDYEALDRYRKEHPEEYDHPALTPHRLAGFLLKMRRKGIVSRGRPPACMRPVTRARERRSPRRSVRRAACRARSPGRKPDDSDPHHLSAGGAR